jgi:hypothetical protein
MRRRVRPGCPRLGHGETLSTKKRGAQYRVPRVQALKKR